MPIYNVLYNEELTNLEREWPDRERLSFDHPRRIWERKEAAHRANKRMEESMGIKRLDESRQIELAQMTDFMEEDEKFLEKILDEAGIGAPGDYEKYRLSMAKYWLAGARSYIEDVIETWLEKDNAELYGEKEPEQVKDIPVTVVLPDKVKTITPATTTTVVDDKGVVSTAEVLPPTPKESKPEAKKPWLPPYKDEDKIKAQIKEIINETPIDERHRPGFLGWLAGSATAALGGKTEPALMLSKVREVLESM